MKLDITDSGSQLKKWEEPGDEAKVYYTLTITMSVQGLAGCISDKARRHFTELTPLVQ